MARRNTAAPSSRQARSGRSASAAPAGSSSPAFSIALATTPRGPGGQAGGRCREPVRVARRGPEDRALRVGDRGHRRVSREGAFALFEEEVKRSMRSTAKCYLRHRPAYGAGELVRVSLALGLAGCDCALRAESAMHLLPQQHARLIAIFRHEHDASCLKSSAHGSGGIG